MSEQEPTRLDKYRNFIAAVAPNKTYQEDIGKPFKLHSNIGDGTNQKADVVVNMDQPTNVEAVNSLKDFLIGKGLTTKRVSEITKEVQDNGTAPIMSNVSVSTAFNQGNRLEDRRVKFVEKAKQAGAQEIVAANEAYYFAMKEIG